MRKIICRIDINTKAKVKEYFWGINFTLSGTKIQPKEEVFGRISLRTSGQKLRSGPPNPGKKSNLERTSRADVHEKTSVLKKLRADFPFPTLISVLTV